MRTKIQRARAHGETSVPFCPPGTTVREQSLQSMVLGSYPGCEVIHVTRTPAMSTDDARERLEDKGVEVMDLLAVTGRYFVFVGKRPVGRP